MKYQEIEGDLISLAQQGLFDVITHGCNCFCTQKSGIAPLMVKAFGTDKFEKEKLGYEGDYNKLGNIDFQIGQILDDLFITKAPRQTHLHELIVVNSYTQYHYGNRFGAPLDYAALELCLKKINHQFKGKHLGINLIGCGLAGGEWSIVKQLIINCCKDMDITVVHFKK